MDIFFNKIQLRLFIAVIVAFSSLYANCQNLLSEDPVYICAQLDSIEEGKINAYKRRIDENELLQRALLTCENNNKESLVYARLLFHKAQHLERNGEIENAVTTCTTAYQILEKQTNSVPVELHVKILSSLSYLYFQLGKVDEIKKNWKKLDYAVRVVYTDHSDEYATELFRNGTRFIVLGEGIKGAKMEQKASKIWIEIGQPRDAVFSQTSAAMALSDAGKHKKAIDLLLRIQTSYSKLVNQDDSLFMQISNNALTIIYAKQNNLIKLKNCISENILLNSNGNTQDFALYTNYALQEMNPRSSMESLLLQNDNELKNFLSTEEYCYYQWIVLTTSLGCYDYDKASYSAIHIIDHLNRIGEKVDSVFLHSLSKQIELSHDMHYNSWVDLWNWNWIRNRIDNLLNKSTYTRSDIDELRLKITELLYGITSEPYQSLCKSYLISNEIAFDKIRSRVFLQKNLNKLSKVSMVDDKAIAFILGELLQTYDIFNDDEREEYYTRLQELYIVEKRLYGNDLDKYNFNIKINLNKLKDISFVIDESLEEPHLIGDKYFRLNNYAKAFEMYKKAFGKIDWHEMGFGIDVYEYNEGMMLSNFSECMEKLKMSQLQICETIDSIIAVNMNHPKHNVMLYDLLCSCTSWAIKDISLKENLVSKTLGYRPDYWSNHPEEEGLIRLTIMWNYNFDQIPKHHINKMERTILETKEKVAEFYGTNSGIYEDYIKWITINYIRWCNEKSLDDSYKSNRFSISLMEEVASIMEARNQTYANGYAYMLVLLMKAYSYNEDFVAVLNIANRYNVSKCKPLPSERNNAVHMAFNNVKFSTLGYVSLENLETSRLNMIVNAHNSLGNQVTANDALVSALQSEVDNLRSLLLYEYNATTALYISSSLMSKTAYYAIKYKEDLRFAEMAYNVSLFTKGLLLRSDAELKRTIMESPNLSLKQKVAELNALQQKTTSNSNNEERKHNVEKMRDILSDIHFAVRTLDNYTKKLTASYQDVRAQLSKSEIAVEFVSYKDHTSNNTMYVALVLTPKQKVPYVIPICYEEDLIESNNGNIYNLIWKPIVETIHDVNRIYFSPCGLLHNIAVESAIRENGSMLSDDVALFRLSNTRQIIPSELQFDTRNALILGGIQYSLIDEEEYNPFEHNNKENSISNLNETSQRGAISSIIEYLPGTEIELNNIAPLLNSTSILTHKEATEDSLRTIIKNRFSVIHIATHGFYQRPSQLHDITDNTNMSIYGEDTQQDLALSRCGLYLAGANDYITDGKNPISSNDGILTAREISGMDLSGTNLVTLSACETALGEVFSDGVFGLQRGFKKAGANSILMSLWKVDDEATCKLMTEFYSNWIGKKMTKHDALEAAKKTVRETKGWEDPKYWAAFILLDGLD